MADYEESTSGVIDGYTDSSVSEDTVAAIETALEGSDGVFISDGTSGESAPEGQALILDFSGGVPEGAPLGEAVVVDASAATEAVVLGFPTPVSPPPAPLPPQAVLGSAFNDVVSNSGDRAQVIEAGGGNDSVVAGSGSDSISGGAGDDTIDAGVGNDHITFGDGNDSVDGGAGFDTAFANFGNAGDATGRTLPGNSSVEYTFDGETITFTDGSGDQSTLTNVQYIETSNNPDDVIQILDNKTHAAVSRSYEGFGRKADAEGLAYWTNLVEDQGEAATVADIAIEIAQVANGFLESEEGQSELGTLDNAEFVSALYQRVFTRDGDATGVEYWNATLDNGNATRAEVFSSFVASEEAEAQTEDYILIIGTPLDDVV